MDNIKLRHMEDESQKTDGMNRKKYLQRNIKNVIRQWSIND